VNLGAGEIDGLVGDVAPVVEEAAHARADFGEELLEELPRLRLLRFVGELAEEDGPAGSISAGILQFSKPCPNTPEQSFPTKVPFTWRVAALAGSMATPATRSAMNAISPKDWTRVIVPPPRSTPPSAIPSIPTATSTLSTHVPIRCVRIVFSSSRNLQKSWERPPATQSKSPVAECPEPPLTLATLALAVLLEPPLILATGPLAMLYAPPLTLAKVPLAVFFRPPLTLAEGPEISLS
jgi:hypothetical protein